MIQNKKIIDLTDEVFIPYLSKGGWLEKMIKENRMKIQHKMMDFFTL